MLAAGKACAVSQLRSPLHAAVVDTQSSRGCLVVVHGKPPQKNVGLYFDYEPVDPKAQQKQAYEDAERIEEEFSWVSRARMTSKEHRLAGKDKKKSKSRKMWEKKQREEAAARSIHRTAPASPPPNAMDASTGTASPAVPPLAPAADVQAVTPSPAVGDPWADDTATASSPSAPSKQAPQKEVQSNASAPKSAMRARKQRLMQRMKGEASAPADVGSSTSTFNSRQWTPAATAAAATPVVVPTVVETDQPTISPRQASTADSVTPKPKAAPIDGDGDFEFDENMDVNAFAQQLIEMLTGRGGDDDMDDDDFDFDLSKLGLDVDDDMDLDLGALDKLSDDEVKKYLDLLGDDDDDDQDNGDFDDIVSKIEEDDSLDDKEKMRALYSVQGMLNTPAQPSNKPKKPADSGPPRNRSSTTGMAKSSTPAPGESKEDIVVPLKPKPPRPGK